MIASLIKIIILFLVVYFVIKFIRFILLLMKTATVNINNASRNNDTVDEKKNMKPDVIELNKDQYRVD